MSFVVTRGSTATSKPAATMSNSSSVTVTSRRTSGQAARKPASGASVRKRSALYGVAAALPVFEAQGAGHFVHVTSVADRGVVPTAAVYSATKYAVRALSEGLRQEVGPLVRVTVIAPGATASELPDSISDPDLRRLAIEEYRRDLLPADAIACAVAFAIAQPADVDVNELVVRPTAQAY